VELVLTALALLGFATGHSAHLALFAAHAVGAGWIAWRLLRTQPLTAMFIVAYLAMYFPNPIGILMGWIPPDSSDGVFFKSNALVLLGLDLFLVGARRLRLTRLGVNRLPRMRLSAFPVETTIMVLLALSALALFFLITTVQALGVNIFQVAKTYRSTGAASTYFLIASYCSMLLPLAVFLIGLKRLPAQVPYLAIVAVLLTLHFFIFRVRTIPVAVIMAYGVSMAARAYFVTLTSYTWRRRIPLWVRAALFIGVPLLPVVGVGIKYLRYSHELRDYRYDDARMSVTIEQTFSGGDFGYTFFTRRAVARFPENHPFLGGQSYYRILFAPIPRAIWPNKPLNTERIFAAILDPDFHGKGITIPPGIVGDLYINFGTIGVLGMLAFGAAFGQEKYRRLTDLLFLAAAGNWLFHLCRGAFTNPIMTLLVTWAAAALCTRFIRPVRAPVAMPVTDAQTLSPRSAPPAALALQGYRVQRET
jgi:hypothetical protein